MSIFTTIGNFFRGLGSGIKALFIKAGASPVIAQELKAAADAFGDLAIQAAETLIGFDFNGDARIAGKQEILAIAASTGAEYLAALTDRGLDELDAGRFKRELAAARIIARIVTLRGIPAIPRGRIINFLIEFAVNALAKAPLKLAS